MLLARYGLIPALKARDLCLTAAAIFEFLAAPAGAGVVAANLVRIVAASREDELKLAVGLRFVLLTP